MSGPETTGPLQPLARIERYLDEYTAALSLPPNLISAIRYALLGGGKRLRPLLAWHCCEAVGGRADDALPGAAALELVHAFSLVHDDLPAMDDDDLRRGKPTLHIHAGEAMAILTGDAMLALAFQVLTERTRDPVLAAALVRELTSATTAMIAGQVYDTLGGLPQSDPRLQLETIHRNKTGALIRGSCRIGALSGGADGRAMDAITAYGEHIGLVFQIVDDLLDVEGTPELSGKRTRKDASAGKITYPGVLGVEGSRREVERLTESARKVLEPLGAHAAVLMSLADALAKRTG